MLIFFKINLIIYQIWWFFVAIEPAEPPVRPVNQWASHLTGSLIGPIFETMVQHHSTADVLHPLATTEHSDSVVSWRSWLRKKGKGSCGIDCTWSDLEVPRVGFWAWNTPNDTDCLPNLSRCTFWSSGSDRSPNHVSGTRDLKIGEHQSCEQLDNEQWMSHRINTPKLDNPRQFEDLLTHTISHDNSRTLLPLLLDNSTNVGDVVTTRRS
jgi:hypothetical protein